MGGSDNPSRDWSQLPSSTLQQLLGSSVGPSRPMWMGPVMEQQQLLATSMDPTIPAAQQQAAGSQLNRDVLKLVMGTGGADVTEPWESFPHAQETVGDLKVGKKIPNLSSISASLGDDYGEVPGVREFPMSALETTKPHDLFANASDHQQMRDLAQQIKANGRIDPVIIAYDKQGPYILEGAHRIGALHMLNKTHVPALIVTEP